MNNFNKFDNNDLRREKNTNNFNQFDDNGVRRECTESNKNKNKKSYVIYFFVILFFLGSIIGLRFHLKNIREKDQERENAILKEKQLQNERLGEAYDLATLKITNFANKEYSSHIDLNYFYLDIRDTHTHIYYFFQSDYMNYIHKQTIEKVGTLEDIYKYISSSEFDISLGRQYTVLRSYFDYAISIAKYYPKSSIREYYNHGWIVKNDLLDYYSVRCDLRFNEYYFAGIIELKRGNEYKYIEIEYNVTLPQENNPIEDFENNLSNGTIELEEITCEEKTSSFSISRSYGLQYMNNNKDSINE